MRDYNPLNGGQAVKFTVKKHGGGIYRGFSSDVSCVFGLFAYPRGHTGGGV